MRDQSRRFFSQLKLVVISTLVVVAVSHLIVQIVDAAIPISTLQVTLKGKTYEVHDVTTITELQERLEEVSGVAPKQQGRVLWNGQRLGDDALSDVGVKDGDQLNCIPSSSSSSQKKKKSTSTSSSTASTKSTDALDAAAGATTTTTTGPPDASTTPIKDIMKNAGMDSSGMDELMKMMGRDGNDSGAGPSLKESMSMMTDMMKSPLFTQLMNDPEKLEESRQMIVNNPMLKQMMASMPGMEEILNDPVAWREAMQAAANVYQNMDPDVLMKAMMEGANAGLSGMGGGAGAGGAGAMGLPPGFFNDINSGSNLNAEVAALDELSEGE